VEKTLVLVALLHELSLLVTRTRAQLDPASLVLLPHLVVEAAMLAVARSQVLVMDERAHKLKICLSQTA